MRRNIFFTATMAGTQHTRFWETDIFFFFLRPSRSTTSRSAPSVLDWTALRNSTYILTHHAHEKGGTLNKQVEIGSPPDPQLPTPDPCPCDPAL
jgi:hypothetical protein